MIQTGYRFVLDGIKNKQRKKPLPRRTYCNTDKSIPSPGRTLPDTGRDHPADEKRPDQITQCAQEKAR